MVKLSHRLLAAAAFVTTGSIVADIGCDHAYTSIYLIQAHIADFCIAMDIKEGPLKRAKENIRKYGCEEKIEIRQSDGLKKLQKGEADTILISGMGGLLIQRILEESKEIVKNVRKLILQPQSYQENVRRTLHFMGFEIKKETMLKEEEKYYTCICAEKSENEILYYKDKIEYLFGKILLDRKDPCLFEYLQNRQQKYEEILKIIKQQGKEESYKEIEKKLLDIKKGQKQYRKNEMI